MTEKTATIVHPVIMIFVRTAPVTADHAMRQFVLAVEAVVQTVMSSSAKAALEHVLNAARVFVNCVWKKLLSVNIVTKNWRMKIMKTQKKKIISKSQVNKNRPVLTFTPYAWAKLLYFRDKSDNEIGGFGITEKDDLLLITDFVTVKQDVSCVSVSFDDNAVADFF